jgi:predicted RNA-binding protein with PIN domain
LPYLVDGNNVMGASFYRGKNRNAVRRRFIGELAGFVKARHVKLAVVFDGVPDANFPEGVRFRGVEIRYARPGADADARIKELALAWNCLRDLVVVTSDKPLGSVLESRGAKIIKASAFRRMMEEASAGTIDKPLETTKIDVDDWLAYFHSRRGCDCVGKATQ